MKSMLMGKKRQVHICELFAKHLSFSHISRKTSLLNILSGRSVYESGVISINGDPVTAQSMKRLMSKIAYVKQQDVFFEHLTVRDQLTYTALLRLPSDISKARKHDEVNKIIGMLRLNKVAESPIMLLSGGEKKRVNIGTELLTDPAVLLLDEPTSGLDSTSAVSLLKLLQDLAREHGKTIVTSIHQPSSAVFRSFDRLLMLAEGNVVYFGTPRDSLDYLRDHALSCPDGYNAADHWMDLLVNDSMLTEEDEINNNVADDIGTTRGPSHNENTTSLLDNNALGSKITPCSSSTKNLTPRLRLINAWDREAVAEQIDREVMEDDEKSQKSNVLDSVKKYNTSWLTQYTVLTHRCLKNSRSAIFTPLNIIKSGAIGIVAGLLWFQLENTESNVSNKSAYYFFSMTFWIFDSMFNALSAFPSERTIILKERASASYHLSAYFIAKTTSEAPTRLCLPLIYMTISFWMAGVNPSFTVFMGSTGCTLMSVLAGEAIGLCVGASIYDLQKAMAVMTVFSLGLMLLGGFFVENTPDFISWAKYLSPFKYAFDASQRIVFDRSVPCDGSGALSEFCGNSATGEASRDDVLKFLHVEGTITFNVGMLFVLSIFPRYIAYVALRRKKEGERG
jgi:ABC-type multidrug transport system ATPase subunit